MAATHGPIHSRIRTHFENSWAVSMVWALTPHMDKGIQMWNRAIPFQKRWTHLCPLSLKFTISVVHCLGWRVGCLTWITHQDFQFTWLTFTLTISQPTGVEIPNVLVFTFVLKGQIKLFYVSVILMAVSFSYLLHVLRFPSQTSLQNLSQSH